VGGTADTWATTPGLNLNTNTVTLSMWVYLDGIQAGFSGLYLNGNGGTLGGLHLRNDNELGYTWNDNSNTTWSHSTGLIVPANTWTFVALVIEPATATWYLYNTSGTASHVYNNNHNSMSWNGSQNLIGIGTDARYVARTINGRVDEVAVFNRALSEGEVLSLAGLPAPPMLSIEKLGADVVVSWSAGALLEASSVAGPWTTNGAATSPYTNAPADAQKFFRAVAP
jgi:hypothetical protein